MKSVSEHEKFADAFKAFHDGIQKLVKEGKYIIMASEAIKYRSNANAPGE